MIYNFLLKSLPEDKFKNAEAHVKACSEENGVESELAKQLKDGTITSKDDKTKVRLNWVLFNYQSNNQIIF